MCPTWPQIYSHCLIGSSVGVSESSVPSVPHQEKFDGVGPFLFDF